MEFDAGNERNLKFSSRFKYIVANNMVLLYGLSCQNVQREHTNAALMPAYIIPSLHQNWVDFFPDEYLKIGNKLSDQNIHWIMH